MEVRAADLASGRENIPSMLLSLLFPLRCIHCGRPGEQLCPACEERFAAIGPYVCRRCGKPSVRDVSTCGECRGRNLHFACSRAAYAYRGPARSLVHGLKYSGRRRLARLMADLTRGSDGLTEICEAATLTFVPMHRNRKFDRGYNQAELYARALAKRLGLSCRALLLKRHPTEPQNRLDSLERKRNLAGSFSLRRRAAAGGRRVVLVDDVYTTGSTVAECARILRQGLDAEVNVWTFARTVRR